MFEAENPIRPGCSAFRWSASDWTVDFPPNRIFDFTTDDLSDLPVEVNELGINEPENTSLPFRDQPRKLGEIRVLVQVVHKVSSDELVQANVVLDVFGDGLAVFRGHGLQVGDGEG